jgi:hypothetical protein
MWLKEGLVYDGAVTVGEEEVSDILMEKRWERRRT